MYDGQQQAIESQRFRRNLEKIRIARHTKYMIKQYKTTSNKKVKG